MPKHTPLYNAHRTLGARMIEFGGWQMPVHYSGILAEHRAVRAQVGLFDLSHMGEIEIRGPRALEVCQELFVTDVARVQIAQAQYTLMCFSYGGIVDDVIVYRLAEDRFFLCVNAANTDTDYDWIVEYNCGRAEIINRSDAYALIALQGPQSQAVLCKLTALDLTQIRRYWSARGEIAGVSSLIARTGYTGEDGFELFIPADQAEHIWNACLKAGQAAELMPIGLGARDTLRLEAGYLLYGNDIDAETTPLEAGLQRLVRFEGGPSQGGPSQGGPSQGRPFLGREALRKQQVEGIKKQLVGVRMAGAGIPRQGYTIWDDAQQVGVVTSGTQSPMLGVGIALGYVPPLCADSGTQLSIAIRNRRVPATVVTRPFYQAGK